MALLTSSQQQMPLKNSFGKFVLVIWIYIGLSICINPDRFVLVCGALSCTIYVAVRDYEQWQNRPVVTSLKVLL